MGPIQSSLNQLTLAGFGAIAGVAHGVKGVLKQPQTSRATKTESLAETTNQGNIVKIGRNYATTHIKAYNAAVKSVYSANDAIKQKSLSQNIIATRLEQVKAASSLSITSEKKGGSK